MILVAHYPESLGMEILPTISATPVRVLHPGIKAHPIASVEKASMRHFVPEKRNNVDTEYGFFGKLSTARTYWSRSKRNSSRISKFKRWTRLSKAARCLLV